MWLWNKHSDGLGDFEGFCEQHIFFTQMSVPLDWILLRSKVYLSNTAHPIYRLWIDASYVKKKPLSMSLHHW